MQASREPHWLEKVSAGQGLQPGAALGRKEPGGQGAGLGAARARLSTRSAAVTRGAWPRPIGAGERRLRGSASRCVCEARDSLLAERPADSAGTRLRAALVWPPPAALSQRRGRPAGKPPAPLAARARGRTRPRAPPSPSGALPLLPPCAQGTSCGKPPALLPLLRPAGLNAPPPRGFHMSQPRLRGFPVKFPGVAPPNGRSLPATVPAAWSPPSHRGAAPLLDQSPSHNWPPIAWVPCSSLKVTETRSLRSQKAITLPRLLRCIRYISQYFKKICS